MSHLHSHADPIRTMDQPKLRPLVICGPSGVGKGTLVKMLQKRYPNTFGVSVSHTTRAPRPHEQAGVDYHFVSKQQFEEQQEKHMFIEHLQYNGNYYGTSYQSIDAVKKQNLICLLEIHFSAAQFIKSQGALECNYLFVSTKNGLQTLKERLFQRHREELEGDWQRATEIRQEIENRLKASKQEFEFVARNPAFFDYVLFNDQDIENTLALLVKQLANWYPGKFKFRRTQQRKSMTNLDLNVSVAPRLSVDSFSHCSDFFEYKRYKTCVEETLLWSLPTEYMHHRGLIALIMEYTNVAPPNQSKCNTSFGWQYQQIVNVILNQLWSNSLSVHYRWISDPFWQCYPKLAMSTIGEVYFAQYDYEPATKQPAFSLCGSLRCIEFAKKCFDANIKNVATDWDTCYDVYFSLQMNPSRGAIVQFSSAWTQIFQRHARKPAVRQSPWDARTTMQMTQKRGEDAVIWNQDECTDEEDDDDDAYMIDIE
mmetsp:Transcript_9593/g.15437  ORF Transcript_9593/g.15437 Transcript_9593/m.15437 type:complete len:482 (-) Transcript_9593:63-1508(-)